VGKPAPARATRARSRRRRKAVGIGRRIVVAFGEMVRDNPVVRRVSRRVVIFVLIVLMISIAVGVITLNNLVISRSAELGQLDTERRDLRIRNAMLGADIARLAAPPRIVKRARKDLGMAPPDSMASFVYLNPANRSLTPRQRARLEARRERRDNAASHEATTPATAAEQP
jgi:cell division protein FtsL